MFSKRNQHEFKRVKERSVKQVSEKVSQWRELFQNGIIDSNGIRKKLTLQQAAIEVGIPKKTLEDYHQLLKKVEEIQPIEQLFDKKMGFLRQLIKDHQNRSIQNESQTEMEQENLNDEFVESKQELQFEEENNIDLDQYFDLEYNHNHYSFQEDAEVMTVQIYIPQINISKKLTDPWETMSDTYDSENDTDCE